MMSAQYVAWGSNLLLNPSSELSTLSVSYT